MNTRFEFFFIQVFGGLVHCQFISPTLNEKIIQKFKNILMSVSGESSDAIEKRQKINTRHGAVLGLCAFITAFPHSVPVFAPSLLVYLGTLLHDKQPIPGICSEFIF